MGRSAPDSAVEEGRGELIFEDTYMDKSQKNKGFPGGSKTRVNKAGEAVRNGTATAEDLEIIDEWRAAHRYVLNTFQASLRARVKGIGATVAQRHKRRNTIFDKLNRYPRMKLARMDDVAGCRIIFNTVNDLYDFRKKFHKARFHHRRLNHDDKYDYIKSPKSTGYRGIHDVYSYDVNSVSGSHLKGLLIEIQYRTEIQHAWATAVEVIGFITTSNPKFERGDKRYQIAMALASEILARAYEESLGCFPKLSNKDVVIEFLKLDESLGLLDMLSRLKSIKPKISKNRNVILIFHPDGKLDIKTYRAATEALEDLFKIEKELPDVDVVLVKADRSEDVGFAFKNYFSDAKDFVKLVKGGCEILVK